MSAGDAASFDRLRAFVRANPARGDAALQLGLAALEARREPEALDSIKAAARAQPHQPALHHVEGLLHRALGELAPAIAALDRAVALSPNEPRLVHARGRVAEEAGLGGLDWLRRAHALAPLDADVMLSLGAALVAAGEGDAADRLLVDTLAIHPGWHMGHVTLAKLRAAAGRDDHLAALDGAIAAAPRDPSLWLLRIDLLQQARRHEGVAETLANAIEALGSGDPLIEAEAVAATERGDLAVADRAFARFDPLAAATGVHWLRHLLRRGEPERVAALAGRLPPDWSHEAWPYLSLAWRLLGDRRAAWLDRPELVQVIDFGADWPLLPGLAATLRRLHRSRAEPLDQSVRGGTQTDGPLLWRIDPTLQALRRRLEEAIAGYIRALPPPDSAHPLLGRRPRHPRFVGSWSVRLAGGGFHDPHVHMEGWLSSAFYLSLPETSQGSTEGWLTLGAPQDSLGLANLPLRMIEPRPGRLVLFPSHLWHGTLPFAAGERLTVAFDVG